MTKAVFLFYSHKIYAFSSQYVVNSEEEESIVLVRDV